jgi:hypothetical protein
MRVGCCTKQSLRQRKKNTPENSFDAETELSFAQMTKLQKIKKGLCFKCEKHGHKANACLEQVQLGGAASKEQQHVMSWMT